MKKYLVLVLAASLLAVFSCTKKSNEPLTINSKEIKYNNVILKLNADTLKENIVELDKELLINISGITGFKELGGAVFIGCSFNVTDENGTQIMNYKDLYSYYDINGISPEDIKNKFSISVNIGKPMEMGKNYVLNAKIWDKKGSGEFNLRYEFKIKNPAVKQQ